MDITISKKGNFQKSVKFVLTIGGGLSSIISFFSDILMPIAPFGLYISLFMLIGMLISIIMHFIPSIDKKFTGKYYWWAPIPIMCLSFSIITFLCYGIGKSSGEQGFLASKYEIFYNVQKDFNIISKSLNEINNNTNKIAQNTEKISDKIDNVKKEISDDPRKELANRGIAWTNNKFEEVIFNRDYENLKLFLEGGHNLYALNDLGYPIIFSELMFEPEGYQDILLFFKKYGLDLNKKVDFKNNYLTMLEKLNLFSTNPELLFIKNIDQYKIQQVESTKKLSLIEACCIYKRSFSDDFIKFIKNEFTTNLKDGSDLKIKIYKIMRDDILNMNINLIENIKYQYEKKYNALYKIKDKTCKEKYDEFYKRYKNVSLSESELYLEKIKEEINLKSLCTPANITFSINKELYPIMKENYKIIMNELNKINNTLFYNELNKIKEYLADIIEYDTTSKNLSSVFFTLEKISNTIQFQSLKKWDHEEKQIIKKLNGSVTTNG